MIPENATPVSRETRTEAARLLRHLSEPGHSAVIGSLAANRAILSSTRKGISLGRGTVSAGAVAFLIAQGLARETSPNTFVATDAGRATGSRLPVPADDGEPADAMPAVARPAPRAAGAPAARRGAGESRETVNVTAGPGRVLAETVLHENGEAAAVMVNEAESPLAWLHKRRNRDGEPFIDATCFEAGERLRRDMTVAQIMPRVTSRWSPTGGGSGGGPAVATDAMVSARQRLHHALDAVDGDYAGILLDVCGFLKRIEDVERERRWPPRSGKVVLKLALQRLAAHYGLASQTRGPDRGSPRHSRAAP